MWRVSTFFFNFFNFFFFNISRGDAFFGVFASGTRSYHQNGLAWMYALLAPAKHEVKVAGCSPRSIKRKKKMRPISSHLDRASLDNIKRIYYMTKHQII